MFDRLEIAVLAIFAFVTDAVGAPSHAPDGALAASFYANGGVLVPVEAGRRLNLVCLGEGTPVVLLNSGIPGEAISWRRVQEPISRFTRVCAYDRAGYGASDPLTRPADAENAIDDLERLVRGARLPTPLVLVGHSAGGLFVQMFAAVHGDQVAGLVLVDPSSINEDREVDSVLTPEERARTIRAWHESHAQLERCAARALAGTLADPTAAECTETPYPDLPRDLEPKHQLASLSENLNFDPPTPDTFGGVIMDQARARPLRFGDKPLILLTAGDDRVPPGERGERLRRLGAADQLRVVRASTRGRVVVVPGSEHFIQDDKPDAVIDAVREVVQQVRVGASRLGAGVK